MRKLGLRMGSSSAQPENIGGFKADGTPGRREGGGRKDAAVATRDVRKGRIQSLESKTALCGQISG